MTDHQALAALLALPDPPELVGRGHGPFITATRYRSQERRRRLLWQPLMVRWHAHRCLAVDPMETLRPARKGWPLRVVRQG